MPGDYFPLAVEDDESKDSAPLSPPFPRTPARSPLLTPRQARVVATLLATLALLLLFVGPDISHAIPASLARYRAAGQALPLPEHIYFGTSPHSARVWGPGLSLARQNVAATFYIDFDEDETAGSSPISVNESLSAWLEGPARLAVAITYSGKGRFVGSYTPYDAGEYTLHADIYERGRVGQPYPYWQPLGRAEGYNLTVTRQDGSVARESGRQDLAFPRDRCTGEEDTTEGRWVRCEDTPLACVRYGWIWLPRTCYFHIYTAEQLAEQDLWIAVAGTSVWRGIFFAGLDHLLGERAANLSAPTSRFWKCWGRFSAETRRLRLSYLDYREECTFAVQPEICKGDYKKDTSTMLGLLGNERGGRGPDLILWEVNGASIHFGNLVGLRRQLGEQWNGTFLAVPRTESSEQPWSRALTDRLIQEVRGNPENKIEMMDISGLGRTMFDTMEFPHAYKSSYHWHDQCDFAGMHSCSPVDDMIFQMILNYATQRQPQRLSPPSSPSPSLGAEAEMRFCLQCPPQLDFSMRPEVEPECFGSLPASD